MFDQDVLEISIFEPPFKKNKLNSLSDSRLVHSSLKYEKLRAPPLVDYKSIDDYCENKLGTSLQPSYGELTDSLATAGLNNIQNIGSPVVFKSPKPEKDKRISSLNSPKHYSFFSVEELVQVRSLNQWSDTKVCAVGSIIHKETLGRCYLRGAMEKDGWEVLLETTLLTEIPNPQKIQQIFGKLEISLGTPRVKVYFHREIDSINLPLFIESYKLMQKCFPGLLMPKIEKSLNFNKLKTLDSEDSCESNCNLGGLDGCKVLQTEKHYELNDTLDGYDFSFDM